MNVTEKQLQSGKKAGGQMCAPATKSSVAQADEVAVRMNVTHLACALKMRTKRLADSFSFTNQ